MSVLTDLIYGGSNAIAGLTENAVNAAISQYGPEKEIAFPDTAYYFPILYAATGIAVRTLQDLTGCVALLKGWITNQPELDQALRAGFATAVGAEILEGLKYIDGPDPYETESGTGFIPDHLVQSLAGPLVQGQIPGVAVVVGKADQPQELAAVVKAYQAQGLLTFLVGDGIEQCVQGGICLGLSQRVIPLGHDISAIVHAVTLVIRTALISGGVKPGDPAGLLAYAKAHVPAFVNTFGSIDSVVISAGAAAMALGFPVVVDIDLADNQVPGVLESVTDRSQIPEKSLELGHIAPHCQPKPEERGLASMAEPLP